MRCLNERCFSPIACGGFGYCRLLNFREQSEVDRPELRCQLTEQVAEQMQMGIVQGSLAEWINGGCE